MEKAVRILSLRQGFEADHSPSTYEFFALDRLTPEQRAAVQELTGRSPHRHLQFHHRRDWSDIPSDWPDRLLTLQPIGAVHLAVASFWQDSLGEPVTLATFDRQLWQAGVATRMPTWPEDFERFTHAP